jgi:hypothetical protein
MKRLSSGTVEQPAGFPGGEHGRFAFLHDVLGCPDGNGGVGFDHLADDQPVKQHLNGGEVLLDFKFGGVPAEPFS